MKGLSLKNTRMDDLVSLKVVYILGGQYNGFLVLSEYKLYLGYIVQKLNEKIPIVMQQKKKTDASQFSQLCQFNICFQLYDPKQKPKSVNKFLKMSSKRNGMYSH